MGLAFLEKRDLIGRFLWTLESRGTSPWVSAIGFPQDSDKAEEEYGWLGHSPSLSERKGNRQSHKPRENKFTIRNRDFDAALRIPVKDWRRDKHGQINIRVNELAGKSSRHWNSLVSELIETGESTACYDDQFFFDTDHLEGDSGAQDNDLTYDATDHTNVTASEMEKAIFKSIEEMIGYKDDQGDLINEEAAAWQIQVPKQLLRVATGALGATRLLEGGESRDNLLVRVNGWDLNLVMNPRLTSAVKFYTFRTDSFVKPFVLQEEVPVTPDMLGPDSEHAKKHKELLFLVDTSRNAGFGMWQQAVLTTFN